MSNIRADLPYVRSFFDIMLLKLSLIPPLFHNVNLKTMNLTLLGYFTCVSTGAIHVQVDSIVALNLNTVLKYNLDAFEQRFLVLQATLNRQSSTKQLL